MDSTMNSAFQRKMEEAKVALERNEPFWCSDFNRPTDEQFADYLRENGFDISFQTAGVLYEGVYYPIEGYNSDDLKRIAMHRKTLRESGMSENELPNTL